MQRRGWGPALPRSLEKPEAVCLAGWGHGTRRGGAPSLVPVHFLTGERGGKAPWAVDASYGSLRPHNGACKPSPPQHGVVTSQGGGCWGPTPASAPPPISSLEVTNRHLNSSSSSWAPREGSAVPSGPHCPWEVTGSSTHPLMASFPVSPPVSPGITSQENHLSLILALGWLPWSPT